MDRLHHSRPEEDRGAVRLTPIPTPEPKPSTVNSVTTKLDKNFGLPKPTGKMGIMKYESPDLQHGDTSDQMSASALHSKIDPATMSGNAKIAALMSEMGSRPKGAMHSFATLPAPPRPEPPRGVRAMTLMPGEAAGDDVHHRRYARSLPPWASVATGGTGNKTSQVSDASRLSKECQKRGFNPQFREWRTKSGYFKCSVEINGQTVSGIKERYYSAGKAKAEAAKQGLSIINMMPYHKRDDSKHRYGGAPDYSPYRPPYLDRRYSQSHYSPDYRHDEQRSLIERIQSLNPSNQPSERVLADPAACQAFLEGFAVGSRMGEAPDRRAQTQGRGWPAERPAESFWWESNARRREQSPASTARGRLRERSPLPRRDDSWERSTQQRSRGHRGRSR
ncbi:hypothetical protein M434DRAFT_35939 [Hypoxylon sp. CO27-5]|nr:hypothetical protein M434DRAFT_35939 [Hypoxylon sp. CO27-5]